MCLARNGFLILGGALAWAALSIGCVAGVLGFHEREGHRVADLEVPSEGHTGFTLMPPDRTGISFSNTVPDARSLTNHILLNGSGVAAGDVDGDGWCDLFFCGLGGRSVLYRNLGGWRFRDATAESGIDCSQLDATGAVLADVDGDGALDLLVSSMGKGVHCFLNDGHGHFHETTAAAGLASGTAAMTLALADTDGDGDLDLYVANYRNQTLRDALRMQLRVAMVNGRRVVTMVNGRPLTGPDNAGWITLDPNGDIRENGQADVLYRNDGQGRFTALSFTDGTFLDENGLALKAPLFDWTLTAMFHDLNGDGAPDLYVCSDLQSPDRIWINRGDGHFQAARSTAVRKTSWFSMGVDCADLNRDGHDEIFVTDMVSREHRMRQVQISDHQMTPSVIGGIENRVAVPRNTLFLNRGDGDYSEVAYFSGLDASEWSWSPVFLDVDLDGYEDVLISTGFERDVQDIDIANQLEAARRNQRLSDAEALKLRAQFARLSLPKLAFRNRGDLTFEDVGDKWGFSTPGVSQGMALADLDNDGDLDVIVNNMNGVAGIYRNETTAPRLAVRLKGQLANTRGIGARIRVLGGAVPQQSQEMQCGGRYLSSDDPMRVFAAGTLTNRLTVEVDWRNGGHSRLEGVRPNQLVEMAEPPGPARPHPPKPAPTTPLFQDVSALVTGSHHEEAFDDFVRQPLLPRKLSQLGPGVAWVDLDGDGWEDLIIGSGKGGTPAFFRNDGQGGFERVVRPGWQGIVARDQTGVVGLQLTPTEAVLLAGASNYEDARSDGAAVTAYSLSAGTVRDLIPATASSTGPLAVADYDGDGALDLFVGGRVIPGRYPEPASSRLFHNQGGKLVEDPAAVALLQGIGMVSGAVWSDLDGDGYPELILACEWGPIRVFHNTHGRLSPWEIPLNFSVPPTLAAPPKTLDALRGWWNGVTVGDFDGDGRMDIVASNWGQNHRYQRYAHDPLRIYYGDFNGSGGVDLLEAHFEPAMNKIVPWSHLGRVGSALPFVLERFSTFRQFADASIEEILGSKTTGAQQLQANWLASTLFLNRGDHFEVRPLPAEAQFAPAFALCAADLNNDGHEDLFLSQNFFATEPETGRDDAGRGLCLLGDGRGNFHPLSGIESGVRVYGEQRGAALADFDHDGRIDLCVSQNGAAVRLFRNSTAPAGVRVRLQGPPGNPQGIGAQVRCADAGPTKEIHAGGGYWSQDSATLVLPRPSAPAQLTVRWPGGRMTKAALQPSDSEIVVKDSAQR